MSTEMLGTGALERCIEWARTCDRTIDSEAARAELAALKDGAAVTDLLHWFDFQLRALNDLKPEAMQKRLDTLIFDTTNKLNHAREALASPAPSTQPITDEEMLGLSAPPSDAELRNGYAGRETDAATDVFNEIWPYIGFDGYGHPWLSAERLRAILSAALGKRP